jgi:hypothetical protein
LRDDALRKVAVSFEYVTAILMSESNLPVPEDGAILASRRTTLLGLVVVVDDVVGCENREENKCGVVGDATRE